MLALNRMVKIKGRVQNPPLIHSLITVHDAYWDTTIHLAILGYPTSWESTI